MAISGTKGQGWRAIPTQYRKASKIYTAWPPFYSAKKTQKIKAKLKSKNSSNLCTYHCVQLSYTTQHGTVLKTFPLNLQTNITAKVLSLGGENDSKFTGLQDGTQRKHTANNNGQ